jgi:endoglucanase
MVKRLLILLFLWPFLFVKAQQSIFEINKKLGPGINLGNMFEAPTETEWGNPFQDEYINIIASQGFGHIRVPVRWDTPSRTSQQPPYTIAASFLNRIQHVIDLAKAKNMMVIINMHHHDALFDNPAGQKEKFISQWAQIASHFKAYDQSLVFEVLNEPHAQLTAELWNEYFAEALQVIRKVSPSRAVLLGTAEWGGTAALAKLKVPKDEHLILTLHYYSPFPFTHQGAEWVSNSMPWLGTKWENTEAEQTEIKNDITEAITVAKANNMPLHVGEFGAYNKADQNSRVLWTSFIPRWLESKEVSWAYWDFSAGFGIYNTVTKSILQPLADALLKNPLPPAKVLNTKIIYASDFATANGWNLFLQNQAKGIFNQKEGKALIEINENSSEGWHAQWVKTNINLKKDHQYTISFDIQANVNAAAFTTYLGRNGGNFEAYSDYKGATASQIAKRIYMSFKMGSADDPTARMVFDFGKTKAIFTIQNIKIEEEIKAPIQAEEPKPVVLAKELPNENIKILPNPASDFLEISGIEPKTLIEVYTSHGKLLLKTQSHTTNQKIKIGHWPAGYFVVYLYTIKGVFFKKILKYN